MAKLDIRLGNSAGQDVEARAWSEMMKDPQCEMGGCRLNKERLQPKKDLANKKAVDRMNKKAKAGKQRAKKALNMSEISDERLDEILNATGEKEDRAKRRAGLLN